LINSKTYASEHIYDFTQSLKKCFKKRWLFFSACRPIYIFFSISESLIPNLVLLSLLIQNHKLPFGLEISSYKVSAEMKTQSTNNLHACFYMCCHSRGCRGDRRCCVLAWNRVYGWFFSNILVLLTNFLTHDTCEETN